MPDQVADQFQVEIHWLGPEPMLPGRTYRLRAGSVTTDLVVTDLKFRLGEGADHAHLAAKRLEPGQSAVVNIATGRPVPLDAFRDDPVAGPCAIVDERTGVPIGHIELRFALRRASNIHLQDVDVDKRARSDRNGHKPCVLWFTGLSASGKSTIANLVEKRLHALGCHTYLLDDDNIRHGLNKDLGFTEADRVENIRRIAELARLMVDAGLITLVSFISPFRSERRMARSLVAEGEFIEIFVDTPLEVAEARDPKGLYRKARRGELKNFTGIDSPYEPPENAEIRIATVRESPLQASQVVLGVLMAREIVPSR